MNWLQSIFLAVCLAAPVAAQVFPFAFWRPAPAVPGSTNAYPDPVVFWKMEESGGDRLTSLGDTNLVLYEFGAVANVAGKINNAADMSSAGTDYLQASNNPAFKLGTYSNGVTFAGWFRLSSTGDQDGRMLCCEGTGGTDQEWLLYLSSGWVSFYYVDASYSTGSYIDSTAAINADEWWFISCGVDSGGTPFLGIMNETNTLIYVTGTAGSGFNNQNLPFQINGTTNETDLADFRIDALGIWATNLSQSQLETLAATPREFP